MGNDKYIVCADCGVAFTFTASEQEFYQTKGFTNEPKRCPDCRQIRRNAGQTTVREMTSVVCSGCGIETTVPFRPTSGRPVYCPECYQKQKAG